jgi:hypothetical protein
MGRHRRGNRGWAAGTSLVEVFHRRRNEMKRMRLLLVLVAVLLASAALSPAVHAGTRDPICEIYCWDYGTFGCFQDSYCNYWCCDYSDPTCRQLC